MIDTDVLIVGGGPVGIAAAIDARLAGLTAVVMEPRSFPIDKACGELLLPGCLPLLERLGVVPEGMPLRGIGYYGTGAYSQGAEHEFARSQAMGIRRPELHHLLVTRMHELGIERDHGRLTGLHQDAHGVTAVNDLGYSIRAKWLLGCDGLRSATARLSGLAGNTRVTGIAGAPRYGMRRHFVIEPWNDLAEVHFGEVAEVAVTPVAPYLVTVTVMGPRGVGFAETVRSVPALAERLTTATPITDPRGAGPFRRRTIARTSGRILLVGDASGHVDALTAAGLRLGFDNARAAVEAVVRAAPAEYEREWRRLRRQFHPMTASLSAVAGSGMRRGLVPVAVRAPGAFAAAMESLAQ
ncbi:NAD(P)/FAD-dependent oxidoreductase [Salinibacterium hongtaonis]|uniref:Monooxygenase n=1 Tax=Homoserinimonas hongtaonis TaxID=2079791 RepID=A0A2U1T216_9MICO|nr:FAD-dependent monooxygenase [Salinibacterium hongtaonis]AWB88168.1 monooxygenase [Salinibacterium hongtaonis]PWB97907.1 monooxygenase [Salinibacterium hongtaonis]